MHLFYSLIDPSATDKPRIWFFVDVESSKLTGRYGTGGLTKIYENAVILRNNFRRRTIVIVADSHCGSKGFGRFVDEPIDGRRFKSAVHELLFWPKRDRVACRVNLCYVVGLAHGNSQTPALTNRESMSAVVLAQNPAVLIDNVSSAGSIGM